MSKFAVVPHVQAKENGNIFHPKNLICMLMSKILQEKF